jgi:hypothetical protein
LTLSSPRLNDNPDLVLAHAHSLVIESFDTGSLVLNLGTQTLVELNVQQAWIFDQCSRNQSIADIMAGYAATYEVALSTAATIVHDTCEYLWENRLLRVVKSRGKGKLHMESKRYVQNPDVNVREQDEDGIMLFNPDNNQIQVLNQTGLNIWELCSQGRTQSEIVAVLRAEYDDVPEDDVEIHVQEFVDGLVESGFFGLLETS